jgi:hypothetical protein
MEVEVSLCLKWATLSKSAMNSLLFAFQKSLRRSRVESDDKAPNSSFSHSRFGNGPVIVGEEVV